MLPEARDFQEWLQHTKNLRELSDELGANWALVKRFLIPFLEEKGFYILSERELREVSGE